MDFKERYDFWLSSPEFDSDTKSELMKISDNQKEIEDRFYKDLEFGTGGLRGIMGAGTNRLNKYTVGKATEGLAHYIVKEGDFRKDMGVVIAHDPRNMSSEFAMEAALVLCGNGIKVYIFDSLRPTPELSFAVRHLKATAGIVITASHNPPEYNGYKVYWEDGGQVPYPRDIEIIKEINSVSDFTEIKKIDFERAIHLGLLYSIGKEIDDAYTKEVLAQSLNPEVIKKTSDDFKIVYTPLNGTGNIPVRRVLKEAGFKNLYVVPEQENPDPMFKTLEYPNPEDPKAFKCSILLGSKVDSDILIATDPDADRMGAAVKNKNGGYTLLSGNMTGSLLTYYILSMKSAAGTLPKNGAVVKTIVTTEIIRPIAESFNVKVFDVLTGFKYIGEKIKAFEENGDYSYIFGFEESYGFLSGTYARDKDAVSASLLLCEMATYYKLKGMTLLDALDEIYKKFGYYKEEVSSYTFKGIDGARKIQIIMENLRQNDIKNIGDEKTLWINDYGTGIFRNLASGKSQKSPLPPSDVLRYTFDGGSWFCVRPSGTEPKLKIYYGVKGKTLKEANTKALIFKEITNKITKE